jgi:hypothetical protein
LGGNKFFKKESKMDKNELKDELADKYYSEDANCLSDFIDILDEYEKLTSHSNDYESTPKLPYNIGYRCMACGEAFTNVPHGHQCD